MRIHQYLYLKAAVFVASLMLLNTPIVQAVTPACGTILTNNTTLDSDMICPSRALRFSGPASKNVTLNCAGFSISTASDRVISADFVSGITIKNCVLSTTHNDGRGIVFTGVKKSKISNNSIFTTGDGSRAIGIRGNSRLNLIIDNTVLTGGTNSQGVLIRSGSNNNIIKNNTFLADASYAASIRSATGNKLTGNTLISPMGYVFQGKFRLQNGGIGIDSAGNIYAVENNWGSSAGGGAGIGKATAFFLVDPVTGLANSVIPLLDDKGKDIGFGFDALDVLPTNGTSERIVALAGSGPSTALYEIDPATGEVSHIALNLPANLDGKLNGLAAISSAELLATTNAGELLSIDLDTGNVNELGQQGTGWTDVAVHPTGGKAYAVSRRRDEASNSAHLYEIDPSTGQIVIEIGDTGLSALSSIDFALDGTLYGNNGQLVVIDTDDASITLVGNEFGSDPLEPSSKKNKLQGNLMQSADGSLRFPATITLPNGLETEISSALVEISANRVMVDSAVLPFLDEPARITLHGLAGTYRNLLVDPEDDGSFEPCSSPQCKFVSFQGGDLVFDVNGFTSYSSEENADPTLEFVTAVVRAEIKALQTSSGVSGAARKKLKAAEKDMAAALKFLKKGNTKKGLAEISKSVTDLLKAQARGVAVSEHIDNLVEAARAEAQANIDAAIAANGTAALIADAEANMAKAQDHLNAGKADKAISAYKNAWVKAGKAGNSGGGGGGAFGTLNVTGNDSANIGGSFSPRFAIPGGTPISFVNWTGSATPLSATALSYNFSAASSLAYIHGTPQGVAYSYSNICFVNPGSCSGISFNLVAKTVTFDNVQIAVSAGVPNNQATAPITFNGTLSWP